MQRGGVRFAGAIGALLRLSVRGDFVLTSFVLSVVNASAMGAEINVDLFDDDHVDVLEKFSSISVLLGK